MPVLENQRHEAFAQALAKGKTVDSAYQEAGFKPNRSNASRLNANDSIRERVAELQEMASERVVLDREWILARLIENAKDHQKSNPSASNKALELLGKEVGMFIERQVTENHNYHISDSPMSEDDWSDEYATEH